MLIEEVTNSGIYIYYKLSPKSVQEIGVWSEQLGVKPVPPDKLHVTLVSSNSEKISPETFKPLGKLSSSVIISLENSYLDVFPMKDGITNALVLRFKSDYILKRRTQIRKEFNIESWEEEFSPHLTISYKYKGTPPKDTKIPMDSIELVEEYAESLKYGQFSENIVNESREIDLYIENINLESYDAMESYMDLNWDIVSLEDYLRSNSHQNFMHYVKFELEMPELFRPHKLRSIIKKTVSQNFQKVYNEYMQELN